MKKRKKIFGWALALAMVVTMISPATANAEASDGDSTTTTETVMVSNESDLIEALTNTATTEPDTITKVVLENNIDVTSVQILLKTGSHVEITSDEKAEAPYTIKSVYTGTQTGSTTGMLRLTGATTLKLTNVTLDANSASRVIYAANSVANVPVITLGKGATITGGYDNLTTSTSTYHYGSGIYILGQNGTNPATLNIEEGALITGNRIKGVESTASLRGIGVYAKYTTVNMSGGVITNNKYEQLTTAKQVATVGGGIFMEYGSTLNMTGGTISGNETSGGGAAIGSYGSSYSMLTGPVTNYNYINISGNAVISDNHVTTPAYPQNADLNGGAIYLSYGTELNISGGTITGNSVEAADVPTSGTGVYGNSTYVGTGGAIYSNQYYNVINISGGNISENVVKVSDSVSSSETPVTSDAGGAIFMGLGKLNITGGTISNNTASKGKDVFGTSAATIPAETTVPLTTEALSAGGSAVVGEIYLDASFNEDGTVSAQGSLNIIQSTEHAKIGIAVPDSSEEQMVAAGNGYIIRTKDLDGFTYVGTKNKILKLNSGNSVVLEEKPDTDLVSLESAVVTYPETAPYGGGIAVEPEVSVSLNGKTLELNKDYALYYENNIDSGEATIVVNGIGAYVGTLEKHFNIDVKNISSSDITVDEIAPRYETGSALTFPISVYNGTVLMTEGTDYTTEFTNNTEAGTATITITGINNYEGTKKVTFEIMKVPMDQDSVAVVRDEETLQSAVAAGKNYIVLTNDITVSAKTTLAPADSEKYTVTINGNGYSIKAAANIYATTTNTNNAMLNVANGTVLTLSNILVDGNNQARLVSVDAGGELTVTSDTELYYGKATSASSTNTLLQGQMLYIAPATEELPAASVVLSGCLVDKTMNNYAGGAIYNGGTLLIKDGAIIENVRYTAVSNEAGATLTLEDGIIRPGITCTTLNYGAVTNRGTFNMLGGTITGKYSSNEYTIYYYGGVYNSATGIINMSGGTITRFNNTYSSGTIYYSGGGGVYNLGTFNMTGGTITENKSSGAGAGVLSRGTFVMDGEDAEISNNWDAYTYSNQIANSRSTGAGVQVSGYAATQATFTLKNGTIKGNTAVYVINSTGSLGSSGTAPKSANGAGVNVANGEFVMTGGSITDNRTITNLDDDLAGSGAGVALSGYGGNETAMITGGTIRGNKQYAVTGTIAGNTSDDLTDDVLTERTDGYGVGVYAATGTSVSVGGAAVIEDETYLSTGIIFNIAAPFTESAKIKFAMAGDYTPSSVVAEYAEGVTAAESDKDVFSNKYGFHLLLQEESTDEGSKSELVIGDVDLSGCFVALDADEYIYTGAEIRPAVSVKAFNGSESGRIISSTEYTVTYENNINVGTATIKIAVNPEAYEPTIRGETEVTFEIAPRDISDAEITLGDTAGIYTGEIQSPEIESVVVDGRELVQDEDYTFEYSNNKEVGIATVLITGIENYTGTASIDFVIKEIDLEQAEIVISADEYPYIEREIEPEVTVKIGDIIVPEEVYAVKYENNVEVGTAKIIVSAVENAVGTIEKTFEIYAGTTWDETDDGTVYYFENGIKVTGWKQIEGDWYYFDVDGAMATGWIKPGSVWYYMNEDGVMATGWLKIGNTWYYLKDSGAMATGWQQINGKWYYLKDSGAMATGWLQLNGKWYYLKDSGVMATGWQQVNGKWYYLNASGVMQTGWLQVSGKWYYLNANGVMQTGWLQVSGKWYYLNANGVMQTGWLQINGKYYYMYSSGVMATNTWIGNYYVNGNGVWVQSR